MFIYKNFIELLSFKVNEASREKDRIHSRHMKAAKQFEDAEECKNQLQTSLQRSIVRAKPYFEVQQDFQMKLEVCLSFVLCVTVTNDNLQFRQPLKGLIH